MKEIIQDVNEAKERKKHKEGQEQFTTESTFTPSHTFSEPTRTRAQPTSAEPVREQSSSPQRESPEQLIQEEEIQWVQSPLTSGQDMTSSHSKVPTAKPKSQLDRTANGTSKLLFKREKSPPAAVVGTKYQSHVEPSSTADVEPRFIPPSNRSRAVHSLEHSPPPPVPPYNPDGPEDFPLSNKPEYKIERKRMLNTYEPVDKEEVFNLQQGLPPRGQQQQQQPASMQVPLRVKKKVTDRIPSPEQEGHVSEFGRRNKRSFEPQVSPSPEVVSDVGDMADACKGLPRNGTLQCTSFSRV